MAPRWRHEWKKGRAELLFCPLLEITSSTAYKLGKTKSTCGPGTLHFHVSSLDPLLVPARGLDSGLWFEKQIKRTAAATTV